MLGIRRFIEGGEGASTLRTTLKSKPQHIFGVSDQIKPQSFRMLFQAGHRCIKHEVDAPMPATKAPLLCETVFLLDTGPPVNLLSSLATAEYYFRSPNLASCAIVCGVRPKTPGTSGTDSSFR